MAHDCKATTSKQISNQTSGPHNGNTWEERSLAHLYFMLRFWLARHQDIDNMGWLAQACNPIGPGNGSPYGALRF